MALTRVLQRSPWASREVQAVDLNALLLLRSPFRCKCTAGLIPECMCLSAVTLASPGHLRWEFHPRQISSLHGVKVKSIAAGAFHSGCVDNDSNPWVWGHGGHWQLGLNMNTHECIPQRVSQGKGVEKEVVVNLGVVGLFCGRIEC